MIWVNSCCKNNWPPSSQLCVDGQAACDSAPPWLYTWWPVQGDGHNLFHYLSIKHDAWYRNQLCVEADSNSLAFFLPCPLSLWTWLQPSSLSVCHKRAVQIQMSPCSGLWSVARGLRVTDILDRQLSDMHVPNEMQRPAISTQTASSANKTFW